MLPLLCSLQSVTFLCTEVIGKSKAGLLKGQSEKLPSGPRPKGAPNLSCVSYFVVICCNSLWLCTTNEQIKQSE